MLGKGATLSMGRHSEGLALDGNDVSLQECHASIAVRLARLLAVRRAVKPLQISPVLRLGMHVRI